MGAKCSGRQPVATVCREDLSLSDRLRVRIVTQITRRIRIAFVDIQVIRAVVDDAGRAGVNEPGDAALSAGVQTMSSAEHVGFVEELPRSPDSGDSRDMENGFDLAAGSLDAFRIADVPSLPLDAQ